MQRGLAQGKVAESALHGRFPATHLFPLEGHSNWLSYMLVAKKQCGGILKIEQPVLTSTQRDIVVGHRPHAGTRDSFPRGHGSPHLTAPSTPLLPLSPSNTGMKAGVLQSYSRLGSTLLIFWAGRLVISSQSRVWV